MAAGAAEANRQVVADQLAAAAGEDRRPTGEACSILLASVGGESSDAPSVCLDGTADRLVAPAGRMEPPKTEGHHRRDGGGRKSVGDIGQTGVRSEPQQPPSSQTGPLCSQWRDGVARTRLAVALGAGHKYSVERRQS